MTRPTKVFIPAANVALTPLEIEVLTGIYASDYADGPQPHIWSWSIAAAVPAKSVPGVVASLSKKGLVRCHTGTGQNGDDDTIAVTDTGEAAARAIPALTERFARMDAYRCDLRTEPKRACGCGRLIGPHVTACWRCRTKPSPQTT